MIFWETIWLCVNIIFWETFVFFLSMAVGNPDMYTLICLFILCSISNWTSADVLATFVIIETFVIRETFVM